MSLSSPSRFRRRADAVRVGRELVYALLAYVVYFGVRGLTEGNVQEAIANGNDVVDFEKAVGMFWEEELQDLIQGHDWLIDLMNWVYVFGHWPVIAVVGIWLAWTQPANYRLLRNAFLISGAIGLVIFALYPVAPPRLLGNLELVDTVTERSRAYRVLQPKEFTNQYAAMPSLHLGWDLLVGIGMVWFGQHRLVRVAGVLLPVLMAAAIVLTANHYIIDGIAGMALALFGLLAAWLVARAVGRPARLPEGDIAEAERHAT